MATPTQGTTPSQTDEPAFNNNQATCNCGGKGGEGCTCQSAHPKGGPDRTMGLEKPQPDPEMAAAWLAATGGGRRSRAWG
jgi:hypothetical protein